MKSSASRWTIGMALAPAIVAMIGFLVAFLDHVVPLPALIVGAGTYTMLAAMFGGIVLAPGIACTVAAANLIDHEHRAARRVAIIGLALLAVGSALIIYGVFDYAVTTHDSRNPQFFGRPTVPEASVVATVFTVLILGDLYAIRTVLASRTE